MIVTRGVPRLHRDGVREPLRAVRHLHGQAAAAGAAPSALRRARAARRPRQRADPARRGRRRGARAEARCRQASRPSRSASCTPISTARTSGARARSCEAHRPDLSVTLASEVSPEIREYERLSTAIANAYVQPVMDRYLGRLDAALVSARLRLPAAADHIRRRADDARYRTQISDPARRIRARPAARSSPQASRGNTGSTRCCPSTWAAPPRRSA